MVVRGKVEKFEGHGVDLIYVGRPRRTNVAVRCYEGMGPSIPDHSGFITFEPPSWDRSCHTHVSHVESIPPNGNINATYMPVSSLPAFPSAPIPYREDKMWREGDLAFKTSVQIDPS
jgi:hypothetical protein